jgi:oligoendopeptidase F
LRLRSQILGEYEKLDAYLYLSWAGDTRQATLLDREQHLTAEVEARMSFMAEEVSAITEDRLDALRKGAPALSDYSFALAQMRRLKEHRASGEIEATLASLAPELSGWQDSLYEEIFRETSFEPVLAGETQLHAYRDRSRWLSHPDSAVREQGFKHLYAGLEKSRDLVAFTLNHIAAAGNAKAALHHYGDAAEESYASSFLTKAEVRALLDRIASARDVYREIQEGKARELKGLLQLPEVHVWDLGAPLPGATPQFLMPQAREVLLKAVHPLGDEYARQMAALLDPANGRLDVGEGSSRKSGGFSLGFPSFPSVFFAGQFQGTYNDLRVMAHEAGHAVHRELMRQAGILPDYARGPSFLFESFASLNELLLADYLHDHAKDSRGRHRYAALFLDGKATAAFSVAPEAELEQALYEHVAAEGPLSADQLDAMTQRIYARYSIWPGRTPELKRQWQLVSLMYEDPFYDVNYVYAGLLALKYYDLLESDPKAFRRSFLAMLKNGFDAPPDVLLKKFLAIDLHDPRLVVDAQRALQRRLRELSAN